MAIECLYCGSKNIFYVSDKVELHEVCGITANAVTYLDESTATGEGKGIKIDAPVLFCCTCLRRITVSEYRRLRELPVGRKTL